MRRIDATFDEVAFGDERAPRANLPQFVLIAAAVASVGCVSAFALRSRFFAAAPAGDDPRPDRPPRHPPW